MSKTSEGLQIIEKNILTLQIEIEHFKVRANVITRAIEKLEKQQSTEVDDLESLISTIELSKNNLDDLYMYQDHFQIEIKKLTQAQKDLLPLPESKAKTLFVEYLVEDSERSVRNVRNARDTYKEVAETMRELAKLWISDAS